MLNDLNNPYMISGLAGLFAAAVLIFLIGFKRPHDRKLMAVCCVFSVGFMFIGAHLLFFLVGLPGFSERYKDYIYDFQSLLSSLFNASSGMVFYGGLFGAIFGVYVFCRITRGYFRHYLNIMCCAFPLVHAFGRIGCTLNGCCYGIEYHGLFSIHYTEAHINPGISDHIADFPRFPIQPMEAVLELLICVMITLLYLKYHNRFPLIFVYLFTYGIIRFFDEFLRGDEVRGMWGPFSTSQWISIFCIMISLIFFFKQKKPETA